MEWTDEPTNAQLGKTSVRQWADPRQAWVLQPDEYQCGDATAEPDTGVLLLREYPQPVCWLYGGYGHQVSDVKGGLQRTTSWSSNQLCLPGLLETLTEYLAPGLANELRE